MEMVDFVIDHDHIEDPEHLFRCIFYGQNLYIYMNDQLCLSSQAFADRELEPSVDRACLYDHDPCRTQKNNNDGVVMLIALEVRQISVSGRSSDNHITVQYKIDVIPKPTKDNVAHSVISPRPEYQTKSVFRRVRESLSLLASNRGWVLPPADCRKS